MTSAQEIESGSLSARAELAKILEDHKFVVFWKDDEGSSHIFFCETIEQMQEWLRYGKGRSQH